MSPPINVIIPIETKTGLTRTSLRRRKRVRRAERKTPSKPNSNYTLPKDSLDSSILASPGVTKDESVPGGFVWGVWSAPSFTFPGSKNEETSRKRMEKENRME